jgi:hypothetical protein
MQLEDHLRRGSMHPSVPGPRAEALIAKKSQARLISLPTAGLRISGWLAGAGRTRPYTSGPGGRPLGSHPCPSALLAAKLCGSPVDPVPVDMTLSHAANTGRRLDEPDYV